MAKTSVGWIIKTSIVTAFTIAAALIWKDVIDEFIQYLIPSSTELFSKFISAVIATLIVILLIYIFLKAENKTESIFKMLCKRKK